MSRELVWVKILCKLSVMNHNGRGIFTVLNSIAFVKTEFSILPAFVFPELIYISEPK